MTGLYYGSYLRLNELLSCQKPVTNAHDEHLFIVVHQAYELWFKQIDHELSLIINILQAPTLPDNALGRIESGLNRILQIFKLLLQQLDILETMTPLDFMDFRDALYPASGFQSIQFRTIEATLGLDRQQRQKLNGESFDARLSDADREHLYKVEKSISLHELIGKWLERTPFLQMPEFNFKESYRNSVNNMLSHDQTILAEHGHLDPDKQEKNLKALQDATDKFNRLFSNESISTDWSWSKPALQAALFIILYRDEPVLQSPFRILSLLMDIDEVMTIWRYRHALMAQRMIGVKVGTGGSSGHDYLRDSAARHRVFTDLFALSTYLLPRSRLPKLPDSITKMLGYHYAT